MRLPKEPAGISGFHYALTAWYNHIRCVLFAPYYLDKLSTTIEQ
jgi:hypothetical protein